MKRWIVALIAVAFLAGGPALAGGKRAGKSSGNCPLQKTTTLGCGQAMKAGAGCGTAGDASMTRARRPLGAAGRDARMAGGHGHGVAACSPEMRAACGADQSGCSMMHRGFGPGRAWHSSHDPSNIWYRGPASRSSVAGWAHDGGRPCGHGDMCRAGKAGCGPGMNADCRMDCARACEKAGAGKLGCGPGMNADCRMDCARACQMAGAGKPGCGPGMSGCAPGACDRGWTPWKSGCGSSATGLRGACCPGSKG